MGNPTYSSGHHVHHHRIGADIRDAIAIAVGNERFEFNRLLGVLFGAVSILLIVGPEAALKPLRRAHPTIE